MSEGENQEQKKFRNAAYKLGECVLQGEATPNNQEYVKAMKSLRSSLEAGANPTSLGYSEAASPIDMYKEYSYLPFPALAMIKEYADKIKGFNLDKTTEGSQELIGDFVAGLNESGLRWLDKQGVKLEGNNREELPTKAIEGYLAETGDLSIVEEVPDNLAKTAKAKNHVSSTSKDTAGRPSLEEHGKDPRWQRLVDTLSYLKSKGLPVDQRNAEGKYVLVQQQVEFFKSGVLEANKRQGVASEVAYDWVGVDAIGDKLDAAITAACTEKAVQRSEGGAAARHHTDWRMSRDYDPSKDTTQPHDGMVAANGFAMRVSGQESAWSR